MAELARYETFRTLLRNGIGSRTNTEFSEATGIARETISRLLNKELIPQPSKDTLVRIAKNIRNCTLNDLYESCGYPRVTLEEHVADMENELILGIENHLHETWTSVDRFAGSLEYFGLRNGMITADDDAKEIEVTDEDNPADYRRNIRMNWAFENCEGECKVTLYYVKNKKGHDVFTSYKFVDEDVTTDWNESPNNRYRGSKTRHILHTAIIVRDKVKQNVEKKLLESIFGKDCETYISETILGIGFTYAPKTDDDINVFNNFVNAHAENYCTSDDKNRVFKIISNFEGTLDELNTLLLDNEKTTMADIIAEIMASETGDMYEAWPDEELDDGSCLIMYKCENRMDQMNPSKETLMALSRYARELNVPEFGACYREIHEPKTADTYKTSEFRVTF